MQAFLNSHFDFQGGILQYHQWITAYIGGVFFGLGFLFQQGAWIYFYLIGMIKIMKDTVKQIKHRSWGEVKALDTRPLIYYLVSALIVTIVMVQSGHQFPDLTLGLGNSLLEVVP